MRPFSNGGRSGAVILSLFSSVNCPREYLVPRVLECFIAKPEDTYAKALIRSQIRPSPIEQVTRFCFDGGADAGLRNRRNDRDLLHRGRRAAAPLALPGF